MHRPLVRGKGNLALGKTIKYRQEVHQLSLDKQVLVDRMNRLPALQRGRNRDIIVSNHVKYKVEPRQRRREMEYLYVRGDLAARTLVGPKTLVDG